ncbi:MAG: hypothetical protein EPO24_05875 [Bacteroidetes bacterium]|nr:MAG: hypothetical protein EPO24_05875 [Bacteroidota bacterium]
MIPKIAYISFLLLFLFAGCIQQIAISSIGSIMDNGFTVLNREEDLDIAEKSIASNLKLLEAVMESDPDNEHFQLLASMGYSSYALAFAEDATPERAKLFYLRGRDYGLKILLQNKKFAAAFDKELVEFSASLNTFSNDDIPAIFWTAIGWGGYAYLSLSDPEAIAALPKIEAMMQFVARRQPDYFQGGAHFFLGTLYGSMPKALGGNPDNSKKEFEKALQINQGKFLMTYIYYARSYAVQTQNKELFKNCLNTVDTTSLDVLPDMRLSNAVAKKKAVLLRERISDFFLEEEPIDSLENEN